MLEFLNENSEAIIAVGTIIISLAALIVSIITYRGQKKLTLQSAKPFLSLNLVDATDRISIELENNGVGVAIIKNATFKSINSDESSKSLINLVESVDRNMDKPYFQNRTLWKRYEESLCNKAIAPQSKRYLLEFPLKDPSKLPLLREILSKIEVEIIYTSIYEKDSYTLSDNLKYYHKNM